MSKSDIGGSNTPDEFKDLWMTPPEVFAYFNHYYNLRVDVAALPESALCNTYVTPEQDALKQDWAALAKKAGGSIWCNPPYSVLQPWIDKAIEAADNGATVVMLVHGNYDTKWFKRMHETCDKIFLLNGGRLAFIRADTGKKGDGNKRPSVFAVWRGKSNRPKALITLIDKATVMKRGAEFLRKQQR